MDSVRTALPPALERSLHGTCIPITRPRDAVVATMRVNETGFSNAPFRQGDAQGMKIATRTLTVRM